MTSNYHPSREARYTIESVSDGEQIRIKAPRPLSMMLFVPAWLAGWGLIGCVGSSEMAVSWYPMAPVWLVVWIAVGAAGISAFGWMVAGFETLSVVGSDLAVAHHAMGFRRRWLFQGSEIRNLTTAVPSGSQLRSERPVIFLQQVSAGAVKFNYGARTFYAAPGLSEAEGAMIVEHLSKRLTGKA